jgi:tetratricopeptide (TPR) repeat protein
MRALVIITCLSFLIIPDTCHGQSDFDQYYTMNIVSDLLSFAPVSMTWKLPAQAQVEMNDGLNNLHEEKFDVAIQNFTNVLKSDSSIWSARYYRGVAQKRIGKFTRAIFDLKKVITYNPKFIEGLIELGKAYQLNGNISQARVLFTKAKELAKTSPIPSYQLGILHMGNRNGIEAKKSFEESLAIDSTFTPSKVYLAVLYQQAGQSTKIATTYLSEVIKKDPQNRQALMYRMLINLKENPDTSLQDLNQLLFLMPTDYGLRITRGTLLIKQEKYAEAFSDLQKALQATTINQDIFRGHQSKFDQTFDMQSAGYHILANIYGMDEQNQQRVKKAYCLMLVEKFAEAIEVIREVKNYKSYAFCLFLVGVSAEYMGDHSLALTSYNSASKLDSDIWDVHKKIAIYESSIQNWKKAESEFSIALKINQDLKSLYKLRGVARFLTENYKGAEQDFTRYLQFDSLDKEAIENRARTYFKVGKLSLAIKDYFRVVDSTEWNIYDSEKVQTIAELLVESGDTLTAVKTLDRFFSKIWHKPSNDLKFQILLDQRDVELLKSHYEKFLLFAKNHPEVYKEIDTYVIKAACYSRFGEYELANQFFEKAIENNPYNGWIYLYQGKMLLKLGKKRAAIQQFRKSEELGVDEAKRVLTRVK